MFLKLIQNYILFREIYSYKQFVIIMLEKRPCALILNWKKRKSTKGAQYEKHPVLLLVSLLEIKTSCANKAYIPGVFRSVDLKIAAQYIDTDNLLNHKIEQKFTNFYSAWLIYFFVVYFLEELSSNTCHPMRIL